MAIGLGILAIVLLAIVLGRLQALLDLTSTLGAINKKEGELQNQLDNLLPLMQNLAQMEARLAARDEARETQAKLSARAEGGWRSM